MRNILLPLFFLLSASFLGAQCPLDNSFNGFPNPLNPAGVGPGNSTTSTNTWGGDYVLTNVTVGNTYTWSTCGASSFNTMLTLYRDGTSTLLAFNNDFCGLQSQITWTATFTGNVRLLLDQMPGCTHNSTHHPIRVTLDGVLDGNTMRLVAFAEKDGNRLEWWLPAEMNATEIIIERSEDGSAFRKVHQMNWHQEDGERGEWKDPAQGIGRVWYRIQTVGMDGQITFSEIEEVWQDTESRMEIWPNPSAGRVRLEWQGGEGPFDIMIYDQTGKLILQSEEEWEHGLWQKHLDFAWAGKGSYWIVARRGAEIRRQMVQVLLE